MKNKKSILLQLLPLSLVIVLSIAIPVTATHNYVAYRGSRAIHDALYGDDDCNMFRYTYRSKPHSEEFLSNIGHAMYLADKIWSLNPISIPYYGGHYINDSGRLVIQLVEGAMPPGSSSGLSQMLDNYNVIVKYVSHSYRELYHTNHAIIAYVFYNVLADPDIVSNINTFKVDTVNSRVVVELTVLNDYEIARFRDAVVDSPALYFKEGTTTFYLWVVEGE